MDNKKIGVIRGFGYGDEFMKADNFEKEEVSKFIFNIRKLLARRIDLTLEDEIVARIKMAKEDQELLSKVEFVKTPLSSEELYITIGYKNPRYEELIKAFNKGLEIIKGNGKYAEVMEKYGVEITD